MRQYLRLSNYAFAAIISLTLLLGTSTYCGGQESLVTPEADDSAQRGLAFLAAHQHPSGSYGQGSTQYRGNVAVSALAGLAFLAGGSTPDEGPYGEQVSAILDYILLHSEESGLIVYKPGQLQRGPMYGHGLATLFLAECYGMAPQREDLRPKLDKAVRLIIAVQNEQGGWRYATDSDDADISVTAAQIMALRAAKNAGLHVPNTTIERCVEYVSACQNPDGGFMYQQPSGVSGFARTAMGVASLQSAGIYEGPELEAAFEYMEQFRPRSDTDASQENYYFFGHYYAVQSFRFEGGGAWTRWYSAVRDDMTSEQEPDGSWYSPISTDYATACACIVLQTPNNYLPIFRR
jgi:hypothetical protein